MTTLSDREALKAHGYLCDYSDSDSGKSEFDDEYYQNKPPPLQLDPSRLIVIRPLNAEPNYEQSYYHTTDQARANYYAENYRRMEYFYNMPPYNCNVYGNWNLNANVSNNFTYQDNYNYTQGVYQNRNIAAMGIGLPDNRSHLEALILSNRAANNVTLNVNSNDYNYLDEQEVHNCGNTDAVPITHPGPSNDVEASVNSNNSANNITMDVSNDTYNYEEKRGDYEGTNTATMETHLDIDALVKSKSMDQEIIVPASRGEESENGENKDECVMVNSIEPAPMSCPNESPSEEVPDSTKKGTFSDTACDWLCCFFCFSTRN